MRTLREGAKQVQQLHKDLHPPTMSRRPWKDNVFARHSLGDDVEVELWYLAEHFLLAWHDWHTLQGRFIQYFGEPEQPLPTSWRRLDGECKVLANRLLRDTNLDELVSASWEQTGFMDREFIHRAGSKLALREVYQNIVQNHRRWSLLHGEWSTGPAPATEGAEQAGPLGETWPRCRDLAFRLNQETFATCQVLMEAVGRDLLFHLRCYRHANLLMSWLSNNGIVEDRHPAAMEGSGDGHGDGQGEDGIGGGRGDGLREFVRMPPHQSALIRFSEGLVISTSSISGTVDGYFREGIAKRVLHRVMEAIAEIGYDNFVADVTDADFQGGPESLVGSSDVNVIPNPHRGPCHELLVAVSKGDKKGIGFPNVMRLVREHLIRCSVTQRVIVLCDHWGPNMLDEHIGDLRAHHARVDGPVRFLFLLVGTPARFLSPVAVDLGATP